jgi:hypothetical protein
VREKGIDVKRRTRKGREGKGDEPIDGAFCCVMEGMILENSRAGRVQLRIAWLAPLLAAAGKSPVLDKANPIAVGMMRRIKGLTEIQIRTFREGISVSLRGEGEGRKEEEVSTAHSALRRCCTCIQG